MSLGGAVDLCVLVSASVGLLHQRVIPNINHRANVHIEKTGLRPNQKNKVKGLLLFQVVKTALDRTRELWLPKSRLPILFAKLQN